MPTYDTYISRHSESWALFIIEELERVEGIKKNRTMSFEDRWNVLRGQGNGFADAPAMSMAA